MKKAIILQKIGIIDKGVIIDLRNDLKKYFKEYIKTIEYTDNSMLLDESFYNSKEKKYDGTEILKTLKNVYDKSEFLSVLGLIDEDIKSKERKYIYGITKSKNQFYTMKNEFFNKPGLAIVSVFRLRESFYSRSEDKSLFRKRVLKVAIHELGHSFGLKKCKNECVMHCKRSLAGVDRKTMNFCEKCQNYLRDLFSNLN
ncbi:MAG: hypothetical protein ACFFBP_08400 [Promethearchaeota archaeon]